MPTCPVSSLGNLHDLLKPLAHHLQWMTFSITRSWRCLLHILVLTMCPLVGFTFFGGPFSTAKSLLFFAVSFRLPRKKGRPPCLPHCPERFLSQYDSLPHCVIASSQFPHPFASFPLQPQTVDQLTKCPMCNKPLTDPRTLSCLHSFCLACLETQKAVALANSSDLRCHQCRVPFIKGIGAYTCNAFVNSLVITAKTDEGDVNKVVKCDLCEDEDGAMLCVECKQNLCAGCSRGRVTTLHQLITLKEALAGNISERKTSGCQKHIGFEVDTYCKTCVATVCSKCITENHPKHDFPPE